MALHQRRIVPAAEPRADAVRLTDRDHPVESLHDPGVLRLPRDALPRLSPEIPRMVSNQHGATLLLTGPLVNPRLFPGAGQHYS